MTITDTIIIHGDAEAIFRAAWAVEAWPQFLPHYREVREVDAVVEGRVVAMCALRGRLPVRWTAEQRADPARRLIYYRHVQGATRGMDVIWRIDEEADGVHVSILHVMTLHMPIIRSALGRFIVSAGFIHPIARRTLHGFQRRFEEGVATPCVVPSLPE